MMFFSASHTAKLEQHAGAQAANPPLHQRHWVQGGVTAHGQVWRWSDDLPPDADGDDAVLDTRKSDLNRVGASATLISHDPSLGRGQMAAASPLFSHPPPPPSQSTAMAFQPRLWISLWFLVTIPVIFWDAGYCFMRPRSMRGGDLHWIWSPYSLYQDIDYVYGLRAFEGGEGFTNAQSALNIVENFMNIAYLYLAHIQGSPLAPLLGFASVVMTLSKTVLYWLQEYYCGGCSVGHNDMATLLLYWVIPNGLWLVVPSMIIYRFAKDIAGPLQLAAKQQKKVAFEKKQ